MEYNVTQPGKRAKELWNDKTTVVLSGGFNIVGFLAFAALGYLPKGVPLAVDHTNRTATPIKGAVLQAALGATDTTARVLKTPFGVPLFAAGDFIGNTTKAVSVVSIDTTNSAYDLITLSEAIGAVSNGGTLFSATALGASKVLSANGINYADVKWKPEILQDKDQFRVFIDENMRLSTYVPLWKSEIPDSEIDFSASKQFSTYTAEYGRAIISSMIEKNADKPLKNMPTLGQITGSIGRMGNRWQLDNDRLQKLYEMEGRFRDKSASYTAERRNSEWLKMVTFLFNPYEIAAIAPHKRLDFLYYEGVSNGTLTVDLENNPDGIQYDPIDLKIKKYGVKVVWNQANASTMDVVGDLRAAVDSA
nr:hypothetical protein [Tanacetum cinerariifolium]